MHKKPFNAESRNKVNGGKEDKPFRKFFDDKTEKPFRKSSGNNDEKPFRRSSGNNDDKPFRKSGGSDDRPFRKSYGNNDEKPFRRSSGNNDDKPFRKSPGGSDDRPFRKSYGNSDEKPFRRSSGNSDDKPFRKSSGYNDDKSFRKPFRTEHDGPFRKPSEDGQEKPFRKSFKEGEDRPFRKSFDKGGDKPFRKSFSDDRERPFKKNFEKGDDKPFRKSFDKDGAHADKKSFGNKEDKGKKSFGKDRKSDEEKKPNRYANAFGKLDDEELIAHKKKMAEQQAQKEQEDEVTFSKEVDSKWDEAPVEKNWGKSDIKPRNADEPKKERHRHTDSSRFKKQFDDENPHEKAYSAKAGKKEEKLQNTHLEDRLMPLNKFIAHCDICSRRDAVTLIKDGKVTVNGELVTEPGHKVTIEDEVMLNGEKLTVQKNLIYILMNKPKGFITTTDDPKGRRTVMEMVENVIDERVFPVGRLDRNTTGLLLLTNDGELTQKLSHPKHEIRKVYKATLDKNLSKDDFEKIKKGVILEDGPAPVDQLEYLESKNEIGLEIHSGKNRIVRRIFESLGYVVEKLDRVAYAGLTKKNIMRGKWRFLTKQEVINLKHMNA